MNKQNIDNLIIVGRGGNLTTICPTILPVILGDERLSQYAIGGVL